MFNKAAFLTDIHFGLKSNSQQHNQDCLDFVTWFVEQAKANNCDTGFFLGDWHHNRSSLNITTLNYSIKALEVLDSYFKNFYFIPGNHDLYYRDRRDIASVAFADKFTNINLVSDHYSKDGVTLLPWMVNDEWKHVKKIKDPYVFGHLELPHFMMNAMVAMPDHNELHEDHFQHQKRVVSGHFHKRQQRGNITYMGNCFPHNYADINDIDRGMMIMEHDRDPIYLAWPAAPKFKIMKLSQLLAEPDKLLSDNTYARVEIDIDISYEEANFIKETFMGQFNLRELSLTQGKQNEVLDSIGVDVNFESVDQIVTKQITSIESEFYDNKLLLDIYNNL